MILVDLRSSFNSYESVKPCSFPDFKDFVKKLMEIVNFCLNTIEICLIEQLVIFIFWAHPVSFSCVNSYYVYYFILFNFFRSKISCTIKWSMKYPFQRVQKPLPPQNGDNPSLLWAIDRFWIWEYTWLCSHFVISSFFAAISHSQCFRLSTFSPCFIHVFSLNCDKKNTGSLKFSLNFYQRSLSVNKIYVKKFFVPIFMKNFFRMKWRNAK